jgi:hypothetical protein
MLASWVGSAFLPVGAFGPARYLMAVVPLAAILSGNLITGLLARLPDLRFGMDRLLVCAHLLLLIVLGLNCIGILTATTEPFRKYIHRLRDQVKPGEPVIVVPEEVSDGVHLYAPDIKVGYAVSRREADDTQLAQRLSAFEAADRIWMLLYRSKHAPVIKVASRIFGEFTSSNPAKPMGKLRILHFDPQSSGTKTRNP